ncbi:hypothetical protein [Hydrogenobaculum acidophilum]
MKMRKFFLFVLIDISLLFYSCAGTIKIYDKNTTSVWNKNNVYAVLPFINYTETPQAGKRVASLLYAIMISKGYKIKDNVMYLKSKNLRSMEKKAFKHGANYVVTGTVNEYRYKTGIDGQPAVSISLLVINKDNKVVWSSTGAKTGFINSSLGKITTELLENMVP